MYALKKYTILTRTGLRNPVKLLVIQRLPLGMQNPSVSFILAEQIKYGLCFSMYIYLK